MVRRERREDWLLIVISHLSGEGFHGIATTIVSVSYTACAREAHTSPKRKRGKVSLHLDMPPSAKSWAQRTCPPHDFGPPFAHVQMFQSACHFGAAPRRSET